MAYRIYLRQNMADTSRDPDEIVITDLAYKHKKEDAIDFAKDYIKNNFFMPKFHNKDVELKKERDDSYYACDSGSWAPILYIEKIKID